MLDCTEKEMIVLGVVVLSKRGILPWIDLLEVVHEVHSASLGGFFAVDHLLNRILSHQYTCLNSICRVRHLSVSFNHLFSYR